VSFAEIKATIFSSQFKAAICFEFSFDGRRSYIATVAECSIARPSNGGGVRRLTEC